MRALVVYESMFGNNRAVAEAIGDGLARFVDVEAAEVGTAPKTLPADLDLLVVGGPNHQFGLSRPESREAAAKETDEPLVSQDVGLREWLEELSVVDGPSTAFATFDTRVDVRILELVDRAAKMAAKRLRAQGLRPLASSEGFRVADKTGPLVDGEVARARQWGDTLGAIAYGELHSE